MFSFGRNGGRVEDQNSPELQKRNNQSSSSINTSQRQYYERPMSPQQQQQQRSLGRGRHNFKKNNNQQIASPRNQQTSPRQPQSPREFQRNKNGRGFRAKRFGGGGFLGKNRKGDNPDLDLKEMEVNETSSGIEVSFEPEPNTPSKSSRSIIGPRGSANKNVAKNSPRGKFSFSNGKKKFRNQQNRTEETRDPSVAEESVASSTKVCEPVISLQDQLRQRQRHYKNQFATSILATPSTTIVKSSAERSLSPRIEPVISWRPSGHRIPLCGVPPSGDLAYTDTVHLLQSTRIASETAVVQQELSHLDAEIEALEQDKNFLEKRMSTVSATVAQKPSFGSVATTVPSSLSSSAASGDWNINVVLREDADKKQLLDSSRRMALQRQRGNCLTIHVHDTKIQETMVNKCGGKLHHIQRTLLFKKDDTIVTLSPSNCRPQGAATCLQDVAFLSPDKNIGFFLSKDAGRSQSSGRMPNKLFHRMKQSESHDVGDMSYLSTGPHGSYYAEFHSGECWWGTAVEDMELHRVLQNWDVYRMAFGSMDYFNEESQGNRDNSKTIAASSWIVVAQDGCVAWKNLPTPLSQTLESRITNKCAPVEVSLGPGGSYFVRFLDGSVDYCLPAKVARVCDRIEKRGGLITNVCLHPDISHDFIIRHTEIGV